MYQSEIDRAIGQHDKWEQLLAEEAAFGGQQVSVVRSKNGTTYEQDYLGNLIEPSKTYVIFNSNDAFSETVAFSDLFEFLQNNGFEIKDNNDQDYLIGFLDGRFGNDYEITESFYMESL